MDVYEKAKGYEILSKLHNLNTSFIIVKRNYDELYNIIIRFQSDSHIWALERRPQFTATLIEITRVLQNYLGGASSLIRHSSVFRDNLANSTFSEEYKEKLKKVEWQHCVIFVKKLRNYTHHCKLPIIRAKFSVTRKDAHNSEFGKEIRVCLSKQDLLKWDGWCRTSKKYIETLGDDLDILRFIGEYNDVVLNFHRWIMRRIPELYDSEIQELKRIKNQINELKKKVNDTS